MPLQTFQKTLQAHVQSPKTVLIGNGFSMAYSPDMFAYDSLFETADMATNYPQLTTVFDELETRDFEYVMQSLKSASSLGSIYHCDINVINIMHQHIESLKQLLIESITATHPENCGVISENQYRSTRNFLSNFVNIFSTNYDLLLYWALVHDQKNGPRVDKTDGFYRTDGILTWAKENDQASYYLHGAMHLYKDGTDIKKIEYTTIGNPLRDQVSTNINNEKYPIFVSEGSSTDKLLRIEENKYLLNCMDKLKNISGVLFIHGHSFKSNDDHIWNAIEKNKEISHICVSIFGDENTPDNRNIRTKAHEIAGQAEAGLSFYTAESANLWAE